MTKRMSRREMRAAGLLKHDGAPIANETDLETTGRHAKIQLDEYGEPIDPFAGDKARDEAVDTELETHDEFVTDDHSDEADADDTAHDVTHTRDEAGVHEDADEHADSDERLDSDDVSDDVLEADDHRSVDSGELHQGVVGDEPEVTELDDEDIADIDHEAGQADVADESDDDVALESTQAMAVDEIDESEPVETTDEPTVPARTSVFDRFSPSEVSEEPVSITDTDKSDVSEDVEDDEESDDYPAKLRAKLAAHHDDDATETVDVIEEEPKRSSIRDIIFFALLIIVGFGVGILIGIAIFGRNDAAALNDLMNVPTWTGLA